MNGGNNLDRITDGQRSEESCKSKVVSQPIYIPLLRLHMSGHVDPKPTTNLTATLIPNYPQVNSNIRILVITDGYVKHSAAKLCVMLHYFLKYTS